MVDVRRDGPTRVGDGLRRVPPHNLQAEESLLGAVLLSREAIATAAEGNLRPDDFYKPAHGHIYAAVQALYSAGEPVDPVTVADELRRADLLDAAGGPSVLLDMQLATPAVSSAGHYARIITEHALLRKLITVAGEIAEIGYGLPDDVDKAIDRAEAMVFEINQRRVVDSEARLNELLRDALDELEKLFERGSRVTGVATGYTDLDHLLSGLQPSTLNVVGARPSMGKCVAWDTPILDPATGELVTAAELHQRGKAGEWVQVAALDRDGHVRVVSPSAFVDDGVKPVFRVTTRLGRVVRTTASHPFLTEAGWLPLRDLAVGTRVGAPRRLPYFGTERLPNGELIVLAFLLGDAGLHAHPDRLLDQVISRGPAIGVDARRVLNAHGLSSVDPTSVTLPKAIERLPAAPLRLFLERLVDANRGARHAVGGAATFVTRSAPMARQVQHLLLRFGVVTSVRARVRRGDPVHIVERVAPPDESGRRGTRGSVAPSVPRPDGGRHAVGVLAPPLVAGPDVLWDEIVEIAADGTDQVYDLTVPELHNFVAADMFVHNTAFALGMATSVAVQGNHPVLFFSLEMGHRELTQRILSGEARVDSSKLRTGDLAEADWRKIVNALGTLEPAPLYIDDNPNVTVMEIRAKARRLKSRIGELGMIVIDYLQLMTGRNSAESRQIEISEISRGLKILARELETPVVALSQLNRSLEQRADKRPMLSDLRESGCLTASTRITRCDTNAETTLGELVESGERDVPVWTLDERFRLVPGVLTHAFPSGEKQVFELRTASGRSVQASANHPFLTLDGWRRVDELTPGTAIATARRVPEASDTGTWPTARLALLGHLIGDGCTLPTHALQYTTVDPANAAVVVAAAHEAFGIDAAVRRERTWMQVYLRASEPLARGRRNPVAAWLDELGAFGLRASEKHIPGELFSLGRSEVALFLRHLWATDGSITMPTNGAPRIYYATSSRRLAEDVAGLLLRMDVRPRVRATAQRWGRTQHTVDICGRDDQLRFIDEVGAFGMRAAPLEQIGAVLERQRSNPNVDIVPREIWEYIRRKALPAAGVTTRALAAGIGMSYCGSALYKSGLSRERMSRVAAVVSDRYLADLATSDVLWDAVVAIEPLGQEPVFDATVEGTHNFLANGIVAHNSIEQDSDVVMFIYRDEVYNPESPDAGIAEVIVAKHRNGPIGIRKLAFLPSFTRFANMARSDL